MFITMQKRIDEAANRATMIQAGVLVTIGTVQYVLDAPNFCSHFRFDTIFKIGGMINVITNPTKPTYCKTRKS